MAYSIDGTDLVINGWDKGISDNPYTGINDMRGVNIVSVPGEVSTSFASTAITFPTTSGTIVSADAGTDLVTFNVAVGAFDTSRSGLAVTFSGGSLPGGIVAGKIYWLAPQSYNTALLSADSYFDVLVNITSSGTGSFTSIDMGEITYFEKSTGVALDKNGRAWDTVTSSGLYHFLGNDVTTAPGLDDGARVGNGLIWYKEYLFLFYNSRICYIKYSASGGYYAGQVWVNEWDPVTGAVSVGTMVFNSFTGQPNPHEAIVGVNDGTVYITDSNYICSLFEKAGTTFDPANTATYTWAKQALTLPATDRANCLAELGSKLLIGGNYNVIYPWDRVSTGYNNAILIADNGTASMITVNTNTFIFAGKRGRIYVTNGSQAQLYLKIPDHISGGIDPIFTWRGAAYNKNQLYFGIEAQNNSLSTLTSYSGLWAVDITTNAIRVPVVPTNTTAGVTAVYAFTSTNSGFGVAYGWKNGTTYGIDITGSSSYSSYVSSIVTDMIPVGRFLNKRTFQNLEFKLGIPLTANEGIKISGRTTLTGAWTVIGENTITGTVSGTFILPFEQMVWLQLKIEMKSYNSSSSRVRLFELRIR